REFPACRLLTLCLGCMRISNSFALTYSPRWPMSGTMPLQNVTRLIPRTGISYFSFAHTEKVQSNRPKAAPLQPRDRQSAKAKANRCIDRAEDQVKAFR